MSFIKRAQEAAKGAAEVAQTGSPLADVLRQQVLPGVDVGWKASVPRERPVP